MVLIDAPKISYHFNQYSWKLNSSKELHNTKAECTMRIYMEACIESQWAYAHCVLIYVHKHIKEFNHFVFQVSIVFDVHICTYMLPLGVFT